MTWPNATTRKQRLEFIPSGGINQVIADWHTKHPNDRTEVICSPSQLTMCPRAVWLKVHGVPATKTMTWAVRQRLLLGRILENQVADQLKDSGRLLMHYKDDPGIEVEKYSMGRKDKGNYMEGVPDYILRVEDPETLLGVVAVSDAKTSRSDSFAYVPLDMAEALADGGWHKYKVQVVAYWMLLKHNAHLLREQNIPIPTHCHLFSYALDDGVVRREFLWKPTTMDIREVKYLIARFNAAMTAEKMPACFCKLDPSGFSVKFCDYALVPKGSKIGVSCCDSKLGKQAVK